MPAGSKSNVSRRGLVLWQLLERGGAELWQLRGRGGLTFNATRWVGFEGEVGSAVGVKQSFTFDGTAFTRQTSPCLFAYSGNIVVNPFGNDRALVPYAATGVGGLRLLKTDEVAALGVTNPTNFLTGNVGGGLKWFSRNHWGARADYRLIAVDKNVNAPEFFGSGKSGTDIASTPESS